MQNTPELIVKLHHAFGVVPVQRPPAPEQILRSYAVMKSNGQLGMLTTRKMQGNITAFTTAYNKLPSSTCQCSQPSFTGTCQNIKDPTTTSSSNIITSGGTTFFLAQGTCLVGLLLACPGSNFPCNAHWQQ